MLTNFTSPDSDFSKRTLGTYLKLMVVGSLGGTALTALGYAIRYYNGPRLYTKGARISAGLSFMSPTAIVISLTVSIIISIALIQFLKSYYKDRELVIGLKFSDTDSKLTVATKTISGTEFTRVHNYTDLSLKYNHLSDGMTSPMYNTLTLTKGDYLAGHLYEDHFTWSHEDFSKISMLLKQRI